LPNAPPPKVRAQLARFGLDADRAETPIANLSGGEKARLLFALATYHGPHLLILDEPTNHLDVDSREALVRALNDFEGAVILISHDRHLIEACADRLWIVRDGTVKAYDGDMEQYRTLCLAERGGQDQPRARITTAGESRLTPQEARRQAAELRASLAPLKKAVTKAEGEIEKLSTAIARIEAQLADAALYTKDPGKAQALAKERGELLRAKDGAESTWIEASEAYEQAEARAKETAG
jgi:ATP-binding cassette subfamily F protein 3